MERVHPLICLCPPHNSCNHPQSVSISTALEDLTTLLVLDLLRIPRETFAGRTITTGATASNIMGFGAFAC